MGPIYHRPPFVLFYIFLSVDRKLARDGVSSFSLSALDPKVSLGSWGRESTYFELNLNVSSDVIFTTVTCQSISLSFRGDTQVSQWIATFIPVFTAFIYPSNPMTRIQWKVYMSTGQLVPSQVNEQQHELARCRLLNHNNAGLVCCHTARYLNITGARTPAFDGHSMILMTVENNKASQLGAKDKKKK